MSDQTVAVVGAGRGLGRGAAEAFAAAGYRVIAVARTESDLLTLQAAQADPSTIVPFVGDATDPDTSTTVITQHRPDVLVIGAGAIPVTGPFTLQTWEEFSANWQTDVRLTHLWLGDALRAPLRPGSRVIVISSGAALAGSPMSGGYAGAKATQRFLAAYAQDESDRRGLDLTFSAVLPRMTPHGNVGATGVRAYAAAAGISEADYVAQLSDPISPKDFGLAVISLAQQDAQGAAGSFLLTSAGLAKLH